MYKTLLTAFAIIALAGPAAATDLSVPATLDAIPGPPTATTNTLELDLQAAYELALSRNLDLQIGRYDLAVSDQSILARSGIFDLNLTGGVSGNGSESPTVSQLEGSEETLKTQATNFQVGIEQLLPTGGQLSLSTSTRRFATTNNLYTINPSWSSDLSASFRQSLLDGFGTDVNRSSIIIAQNSRAQTGVAFEMQIISTLLGVEQAYWDYIKAGEAVAVSEQSLALAERLLRETEERVKVGTSAPIDLVQSEAGVATRRQDLIVRRNAAANAEDALKSMLGFDQPAEWLTHIVASESSTAEILDVDLREAIETALEQRPEIQQKKIGLKTADHNIKIAHNGILPKLDFEAAYGYAGIGGTTTVLDEDTEEMVKIDGGYGDSIKQFGDYPQWTLGLQFSMPIGNNEAKATLAQRRFEKQRAEMDLKAQQQGIILQVRNAVRALHDGAAAIDAAVASRQFAERNLEAEQTKFANGLSTNYNVLEIQEDLAQAQLSEINARAQYRRAIVSYRQTTGTLLDDLDVEIVDPGALEEAHTFLKDVEWLRAAPFQGNENGDGE